MTISTFCQDGSVSLQISSTLKWNICPTDPESSGVVGDLKKIMALSDGKPAGDRIYVSVCDTKRLQPPVLKSDSSLVCLLPRNITKDSRIIHLVGLAKYIALQALPRGGILIHGALIAKNGLGVLLVAPGGTGKTTASNRIEAPWRSLSDDATLVVKRSDGEYYAHPWPTWSRFFDNGPGGEWDVEKGVRLCGVFFLSRALKNKVNYLNKNEALSFLIDSVYHSVQVKTHNLGDKNEIEKIYRLEIDQISTLINTIPTFILDISLTGPYWKEIETSLGDLMDQCCHAEITQGKVEDKENKEQFFDDGSIHRVYSGPSMYKTLVEPGLLKVVPYSGSSPRTGDVICFFSTEKGFYITHRVIRVTSGGVITRGDNNSDIDPGVVTHENIEGKVIQVWMRGRYRKVQGGYAGLFIHILRLKQKRFRTFVVKLSGLIKPLFSVGANRILKKILIIEPRIVVYSNRTMKGCILLYRGRVIGTNNPRTGNWALRLPYALFIDRKKIPDIVYHMHKEGKPGIRAIETGSSRLNDEQ